MTGELRPERDISVELNTYFGQLATDHLARIDGLANQLYLNGNDPFQRKAATTVVHAPALLDDEPQLKHNLRLIPAQDNPKHRSIIIAGNIGAGTGNATLLEQNLEYVESFVRVCGALGIGASYYFTEYPWATSIGEVRADMHAAGLRHHQQQAAEQRKAPLDRISAGWDVDAEMADARYLVKGEASFRESTTSMWFAAPRIEHAVPNAERFPRAHSLIRWHDLAYNANLSGLDSVSSQYFMLNERAYAAAGGFSVRESRAEVGNLILRAVDIFGEDITAETLDATVTVSPRNLAWLMNAGKQAVYRDLITPAAQDYPTYRSFELQQDINASYFAEELSFYISVTLDAFYRQAYRSARKTGLTPAMASTQAVTQAYAEAIELVKAHRNVSVPPIFNTAYSQFFGFITRRTFSGRYPKDL